MFALFLPTPYFIDFSIDVFLSLYLSVSQSVNVSERTQPLEREKKEGLQ